MAAIVLTDATISVNAVDLSTKANKVVINYEFDSVEVTTFSATSGGAGHSFTKGLQNISCDIDFLQDFAASQVEATIFPLVGTSTTLVFKATQAVTSVTNPTYTITGTFLAAHTPINGSVGELSMTSLKFTGGSLAKTTV